MLQRFLLTLMYITQTTWMINDVFAANILGLMMTASTSHHIWNRSLMRALAARGHQVIVLSSDVDNEPLSNYTHIVIEDAYEHLSISEFDYEAAATQHIFWDTLGWYSWGQEQCDFGLSSQATKKMLALVEGQKIDLVIIDLTVEECFLGLVPKLGNPPVIAISAYSCPPWLSGIVGNPQNPSYISTYNLPYTGKMGFQQRLYNTVNHIFTVLAREYYHVPNQDAVARKHLGETLPPLKEIENNISLVMVNIHFSMDYARPTVPAMIPVGGMHITPGQPLLKEIKKFLDGAKHGAILLCLGSNVRSDKLSPERIQAFLEAFSELPQRVLWKWESDVLPGQPENVMVRKWIPQNDVLAHPNVRLFISHSGLLSTQEAVYHGVPIVGLPFFADQFINLEKLVSQGIAEKLAYENLTKQNILHAVTKVLKDNRYKNKMKELSILFKDQPETPLQRAVFWAEYVIRHNGAQHLRIASLDMFWYQYYLLDVVFVISTAVVVGVILIFVVVKAIVKGVFNHKKSKLKPN